MARATHDRSIDADAPDAAPIAEDREAGAPPPATGRGYGIEIFLISFAALLLEISWTRVISFKLFYYYTYLVIGLALLGIGSGAVLVSLSQRLRQASTESILAWGSLWGGLSVGAGYVLIARINIASLDVWDYGT